MLSKKLVCIGCLELVWQVWCTWAPARLSACCQCVLRAHAHAPHHMCCWIEALRLPYNNRTVKCPRGSHEDMWEDVAANVGAAVDCFQGSGRVVRPVSAEPTVTEDKVPKRELSLAVL